MKAQSVHICVFTNKAPNSGDSYAPEVLGAPESGMYSAVSSAAVQLSDEGMEGTTLSVCYARSASFQDFLKTVTATPPFIGIAGTFPDGQKKLYILQSPANVKQYLKAMWLGEFGGTGLPTNMGDGDGGWGTGSALICKLIPPLCALGFLPWLALSVYTTYRAAESRSKVGQIMWGIPAAFFVMGFFERGGVKQIQWWAKKAGIGDLRFENINFNRQLTKPPSFKKVSKKFIEDVVNVLNIAYSQQEKDIRLSRLFYNNGFLYSRDSALKLYYDEYKSYGGKADFERITKGLFHD